MDKKSILKSRKKEIIAVLILVIIAIISFVCIKIFAEGEGKYVKVYVNEKLTKTFDITKDREYFIETKLGYNLLIIKKEKARILDADCPNKICVDKGYISKNGESIICLPHKVVVTVESNEQPNVDAVAD
ncbi:MAG: NusG domain II-containing protein [Eubacterium sp.]|nr:NusG domain II-containing protein [Eubacterium sp.]